MDRFNSFGLISFWVFDWIFIELMQRVGGWGGTNEADGAGGSMGIVSAAG